MVLDLLLTFSWSVCVCVCVCQLLSHVQLFVTPGTVVCQAPLSMEFSGQEYYSGLPCPSAGDLPDPRIEPRSPALQADSLLSEPPGKPLYNHKIDKSNLIKIKNF